MKKTALVIMAAGLGSRFGGGIKQLEPIGPEGEPIMMYSIHDALQAGFRKIVFIIRREIEDDFRRLAGERIEKVCAPLGVEVCCAYQSLDGLPQGIRPFAGREKPWGTGQAVLCAAEQLDGPFAVINADDYYGRESYQKLYAGLAEQEDELCMLGFRLGNTLSENGGVTRGICRVDENGYLCEISETKNIAPRGSEIFANGIPIDGNTCVSMNMWGFPQGFLKLLESGFVRFLENDAQKDPLKAEYLLPVYIGQLLKEKRVSVRVMETGERWFGITYQEDKAPVKQAFRQLMETGVYKRDLFSDLPGRSG